MKLNQKWPSGFRGVLIWKCVWQRSSFSGAWGRGAKNCCLVFRSSTESSPFQKNPLIIFCYYGPSKTFITRKCVFSGIHKCIHSIYTTCAHRIPVFSHTIQMTGQNWLIKALVIWPWHLQTLAKNQKQNPFNSKSRCSVIYFLQILHHWRPYFSPETAHLSEQPFFVLGVLSWMAILVRMHKHA